MDTVTFVQEQVTLNTILHPTMQVAPANDLKHLIRHFLLYYPSTGKSPMNFFSDGSPGIVVPLVQSELPFLPQTGLAKGGFLVYGLMEEVIKIPAPPAYGMIIIVLQPYALSILTGLSAKKLKNKIFRFSELFNCSPESLQVAIKHEKNVSDILILLEDYFRKISIQVTPNYRLLQESLFKMQQSKGKIKINELTPHLPISERHLERHFDFYIGISPKKFNGILRINHFLKLLRAPNQQFSPIQAAVEAGFYDQAHLNNAFKAWTGTSPLKYLSLSDPLAMNLFTS